MPNDTKISPEGWMSGVQRGLALIIVAAFSLVLCALAWRVIMYGDPVDALELLKQLVNALINIVMVVLGFFYGSSKSSQSKDENNAKMTEMLVDRVASPAGGMKMARTIAVEEAAKAAPEAAEAAAPAAAEKAAPPVVDKVVPPVVEAAVDKAVEEITAALKPKE